MDIKERLKIREHKWLWDEVANEAIAQPSLINEIIELMLHGDRIQKINAAQILNRIADRRKELLDEYLVYLFEHMKLNPEDPVKRAIIRIFQLVDIPEEIEGELFEICIKYLRSIEEPIAIKAFSMTAARRICEKYPELANELIPIVEIILDEKISAGMTNRAGKELKKLLELRN